MLAGHWLTGRWLIGDAV